jgi:hypothetical protein
MGITTLRRRDFMRAVLTNARSSGNTVAPWRGVGDVDLHFDDEADLLVELHREWLRLLVARLHRGEIVAQRTPANVRDLYDETCAENPTLRGILDAHAADPALWEPTAREHAMLARIAGLVPDAAEAEHAAVLGRSLVTQRIPVQRGAFS